MPSLTYLESPSSNAEKLTWQSRHVFPQASTAGLLRLRDLLPAMLKTSEVAVRHRYAAPWRDVPPAEAR